MLGALYPVLELKLDLSVVAGSFLLSQIVGLPGAITFRHIAGRIGNKRAVMLALVVWSLAMLHVWAGGVSTSNGLYLLTAVLGFVMGGSQALSRSVFSFLIPKGEEAEYFSLYEISDRGSSAVAPAVLAWVVHATGSFRPGALALAVFFVVGLAILARVDVQRGAVAAGNEPPPKPGSSQGDGDVVVRTTSALLDGQGDAPKCDSFGGES
jgi:UMF1 family MFS transporter